MLIALDFPSTVHLVDNNLVVPQNLQNDDVYLMTIQHSRDRCHHVVFLNVPQGDHKHSKTQGVSKFNMTCQECSNSFVRENHSALVLQAFSFGIQTSPKNRVKGRSQKVDLPKRGRFHCVLFRKSSLDNLIYSSLHMSSQCHVTDSSQYLRPFASAPLTYGRVVRVDPKSVGVDDLLN